jgi:hypothetical protein
MLSLPLLLEMPSEPVLLQTTDSTTDMALLLSVPGNNNNE